ncbi:hypothetical protein Pcinc_018839 [Petrolisthes cinctipes]|uniref:Uncharacterized protein n=1 Tax=Petrolisthes cinctipes TaxID=88211 RepID=A0AAE1FMC2_PETCI|nr:hypothetical protein Pcinc_018839 [Petrolisthes cinctipes]
MLSLVGHENNQTTSHHHYNYFSPYYNFYCTNNSFPPNLPYLSSVNAPSHTHTPTPTLVSVNTTTLTPDNNTSPTPAKTTTITPDNNTTTTTITPAKRVQPALTLNTPSAVTRAEDWFPQTKGKQKNSPADRVCTGD